MLAAIQDKSGTCATGASSLFCPSVPGLGRCSSERKRHMVIMTDQPAVVIGGVDCHAEFHLAVVLDEQGRNLGDERFDANEAGYQKMLDWLWSFGTLLEVGVESTGSYGAGLAQHLASEGVRGDRDQPAPRPRAAPSR